MKNCWGCIGFKLSKFLLSKFRTYDFIIGEDSARKQENYYVDGWLQENRRHMHRLDACSLCYGQWYRRAVANLYAQNESDSSVLSLNKNLQIKSFRQGHSLFNSIDAWSSFKVLNVQLDSSFWVWCLNFLIMFYFSYVIVSYLCTFYCIIFYLVVYCTLVVVTYYSTCCCVFSIKYNNFISRFLGSCFSSSAVNGPDLLHGFVCLHFLVNKAW